MSAVSVVMAVYNGERFLRPQVDSVLAQLRPGDELIAVDDASTDGSVALLRSIGSPLLSVVVGKRNLGVLGTFERGLRLATRDIVFLCDQDDLWTSGKRDAFVAAFDADPSVTVVVSDVQMIDADGRVTAQSLMATRKGFDGTLLGTLTRNRYLGCAMAVRHRVLDIALPIPTNVPMHDMWLGLLANEIGRVIYLPKPYLQYRRHGSNATPFLRQSWRKMVAWRVNLFLAIVRRMRSPAARRLRDATP